MFNSIHYGIQQAQLFQTKEAAMPYVPYVPYAPLNEVLLLA
jgi:hypothetical protein